MRGTSEFGPDKRWKLDAKANYLNNNAKNRPIQGINQSNAFSTIYNLPRSLDIRDLENCLDENGNMIGIPRVLPKKIRIGLKIIEQIKTLVIVC